MRKVPEVVENNSEEKTEKINITAGIILHTYGVLVSKVFNASAGAKDFQCFVSVRTVR